MILETGRHMNSTGNSVRGGLGRDQVRGQGAVVGQEQKTA